MPQTSRWACTPATKESTTPGSASLAISGGPASMWTTLKPGATSTEAGASDQRRTNTVASTPAWASAAASSRT